MSGVWDTGRNVGTGSDGQAGTNLIEYGPEPAARGDAGSGRPVMSIIIAASRPDAGLVRSIRAIEANCSVPTEFIIASAEAWLDPPANVRVISYDSRSLGDRLDTAAEQASGEFLAFLGERARVNHDWQSRALALLEAEEIAAVGGPILPRTVNRSQAVTATLLRSRRATAMRRHLFNKMSARKGAELSIENIVVRRSDFNAVGGFQSPYHGGESMRLRYKLHSLLGRSTAYHPELAVEASPPAFARPYLQTVLGWGQVQGDISRRLPEVSRAGILRGLTLVTPLVFVLAVAAIFFPAARYAVAALALTHVLFALRLLLAPVDLGAKLVAWGALPIVWLVLAAGFLSGFFGRSLAERPLPRPRVRPLRVLILNWRDVTHPWAGGAETYMHEIARRWAGEGYEVGWLSERYKTGKRLEVIDGIRIHRVGGRFTLYPLAAVAYLLRLRGRYDIVVDCENGIPFFTPFYVRKPIFLVVHHVHQDVFRRELPPYLRWFALWLEGWLMPHLYSRKQVIAVSESTRSALVTQGFAPERISVVPNGVDLPEEAAVAEKAPNPTIVHLGRLKKYKSIDVLIRALPVVLRAYPAARLDIIGQGPDRSRLERLAWELGLAHRIRFYGYLRREVRDSIVERAWLAVATSAFEGWGISCMEASAHGLPVVAADVAGLRDSVRDGETGVLVPYGDSDALARRIVRFFANEAARLEMGRAGRQWAAAHSWDRSSRELMAMIGQHVGAKHLIKLPVPGVRSITPAHFTTQPGPLALISVEKDSGRAVGDGVRAGADLAVEVPAPAAGAS